MIPSRLLLIASAVAPAIAQSWTYLGCYSNSGSVTAGDTYDWQSDGHCSDVCKGKSASFFAMTTGSTCVCGTSKPTNGLVSDSMCSTNCTGWPSVKCGGTGFYSFYTNAASTGSFSSSVQSGSTSVTSSAPSSTTATPSVVTSVLPDRTIIVTQSAVAQASVADNSGASSSSTPNTGAIAGGVSAGVIILIAIAGAVFFFTRRSRRAHQEAYQRHSGSAALVSSGNRPSPPPMSQTRGSPETRYDAEAMANRRLSDGSIADNEDFSRRILKVTNPDDRL